MDSGQLLLSWCELVYSSSRYSSMSPVYAPFWHAAGTGTLSMRTVGRPLLADRNCRGARAGSSPMPLAIYAPILHCPCCRQVLSEGVR